jgi:hypothetical protein
VEVLKYLGTTVTYQNSIRVEIKNKKKQNQGMLAVIRWRIFCLPVYYPKIYKLRYTELQFWLLFCMGVKLGLSPILR